MNEEELNPNLEDEMLNQDEEDEFEFVEDDTDEDLSDEEKALAIHNQKTGKNYKSWEDVAKSEKERDKIFAQNPQKKVQKDNVNTVAQPTTPVVNTLDADIVEEVMLMKFPELQSAVETRKELKELAELKGVSELSLYKNSTYFKNRAKAESETLKENEGNKERIGSPSAPDGGTKKLVVTKEDRRIADLTFGGDIARYMKFKESR